MRASDPGRPRLTWYDADGERVELSARVLSTWVAKTANLLAEELDAGPGTGVHLALPTSWRTAVWALATWAVGAHLSSAPDADVVVVPDGASAPPDADPRSYLVVVALPALARAAEQVPAGALDYTAVVAGFGDDLPPEASGAPPEPAAAADWPPRVRLLARAAEPGPAVLDQVVGQVLPALARDGSVVLVGRGRDADRIGDQERVTATV
jgi:uncharacterized protein (TIGR03089 family)